MSNRFDQFIFTSNATKFVCPKWGTAPNAFVYNYKCIAPRACAIGPNSSNRQYCCSPGSACFRPPSKCASDGSTFTCTGLGASWCCLTNEESCGQNPSKINICISLTDDILRNVSGSVLNKTYSSLTSAQPSASSYSFDPYELMAQTQTTSTEASTSTQTAGPSDHHHSLSGGAIAGIVLGVFGGVAVIAFLIAFILKRRKRSGPRDPEVSELSSNYAHAAPGPQEIHSEPVSHEMEAGKDPSELPPNAPNQPIELPATS